MPAAVKTTIGAGGIVYRDVRGVPVAVNRCAGYGSNRQKCIRHKGHAGRHVTSAEYRR